MVISELTLGIASFAIFILGVVLRRYGVASVMAILTLVARICLSQVEAPFPYGCLLSIIAFIVLLILHGKANGKRSPLYQYSPYNPNSRLSVKLKLALLMLALIVTLLLRQ